LEQVQSLGLENSEELDAYQNKYARYRGRGSRN
jgi:hypothetical protein